MKRCAMLALVALLALPQAASAGPYEEGLALVDAPRRLASRLDEAIGKFKAAIQKDKSNAHAWYNLGLLQLMKGNHKAAGKAWTATLGVDRAYVPARARLAELQLLSGDKAGAVASLEQIIAEHRYQPEARNILAGLAIDAEDWDSAIKHARNVLLGDPQNINAYVNLCVTYFKQGLIDQAWLVATTALDRRREMELHEPAALYNLLGLIYLEKDDSRNAAASFLRALKEDPRQLDAKLNLASLELSYGDFDTALKRFDEALQLRPRDAMLHTSRAVALRGLERYDEAQKGYEDALALEPDRLEPYYNLCVLHHQYTNDYEAARTFCAQYQERIARSHSKWREIYKRLRSIDATLEALKPQPADDPVEEPPPAADEAPPAAPPAPEAPAKKPKKS